MEHKLKLELFLQISRNESQHWRSARLCCRQCHRSTSHYVLCYACAACHLLILVNSPSQACLLVLCCYDCLESCKYQIFDTLIEEDSISTL